MEKQAKYIGKTFSYRVSSGQIRTARCTRIEFDKLLGKPVFHGVSPFGNRLRLTREEIEHWHS